MKAAIMQPYFLPYLGYFQLASAVDTFVFFDDVNFIKKGWIHRNNILSNHEAYRFTIPLHKASQNNLINETQISNYDSWKKDFMQLIANNYKKAPFYSITSEWLINLLNKKDFKVISDLASESIISVAKLLGMTTEFLFSKDIPYYKDPAGKGQSKIISICQHLGALSYINPKNGVELYDTTVFQATEIELLFIYMEDIKYSQFKNDNFVPNLSILDVLMFNEPSEIKEMLLKHSFKQGHNKV